MPRELPAGFELDEPVKRGKPLGKGKLPEGFTLDDEIKPRSGASAQLEAKVPDYKQVFASPLAGGEQTGIDRFRRGTQDLIDRASQITIGLGEKVGLLEPGLGDIATDQMKAEQKAYEQRRQQDAKDAGKESAGIDVARIGGGVAPLVPLARLGPAGNSLLQRLTAGAIQGGAAGGLTFDDSNSLAGTARNVFVGGVAGALASPVAGYLGDKIGAGVNYLAGRVRGAAAKVSGATAPAQILQQVPGINALPAGQQADLISEAAAQIQATGKLNAEALERKANLLANLGDEGRVTKSMITRNPQDWAIERNLAKLTGPDPELERIGSALTDTYSANDAALTNKLGSFARGRPSGSQESLGQVGMKGIEEVSEESQKQVGDLYEIVRSTRGNELASDARQLHAALDELSDNAYSEKLVQSVKNRLKRTGVVDSSGNLTTKTLTVDQAEELRKFVNKLPNDFGKRQLIDAIDQDVLGGLGDDAFGTARTAARERKELLANPATQRALNTLGELQEGKTAQNFIKQQVIDASEKDLGTLLKTLGTKPQSVDALRAGVIQHFEKLAINPNSGQFSGAALNKAIREFGETKLIALFGRNEAAQLKSLARAGIDATYKPKYSNVNESGTTPALLSFVRRGRQALGFNVPLINEAAEQGAMRRGYGGQLKNAFAAKSTPRVDSQAGKAIRAATGSAAGPLAPSAVDELRKRAGKN